MDDLNDQFVAILHEQGENKSAATLEDAAAGDGCTIVRLVAAPAWWGEVSKLARRRGRDWRARRDQLADAPLSADTWLIED